MKKYIYLALLSVVFFACKKQEQGHVSIPPIDGGETYYDNVKAYLKINLSGTDYLKANFDDAVLSKQGKDWFLRVAFINKKMSTDFILVQSDSLGHCSGGKFVHIRRDSSDMKTFNGKVVTESFQHSAVAKKVQNNIATVLDCEDEEGYQEYGACGAVDIVPSFSCDDCLPEVIVVGYTGGGGSSSGGISYSDYLNLVSLAGAGSNTTFSSAIYSPVIVPENPVTPLKPIKPSPDIIINYEASVNNPGIDVAAFMKCFSTIPDPGATCSVTIYTDLPVDDNPQYIFNILTGATGHSFLQLTKTNGTQSVTQIIGKTTSKVAAVLGGDVAGKIVDNAGHKWNASLTMNITPAQLQTEINGILAIGSTPSYNMWENDCVDYSVGILNLVRPNNKLDIVMLNDVTSGESYSTPQGLYMTLDQMKQADGPEATNIVTDAINHAGTSHGACN